MKPISFDPLHPLQSAIIETLCLTAECSTKELYQAISKEYNIETSSANLYRIVQLMFEQQILTKHKGKLSLNKLWIEQIKQHIERFESLRSHNYEHPIAKLVDGERTEFWSDSLANLDSIWNSTLSYVASQDENKKWYYYNAHAYHALAMPDEEIKLYNTITGMGFEYYFLWGNDTYLDQYGANLMKVDKLYKCVSDNHSFPQSGYICNSCGDFMIECFFPEATISHFNAYFNYIQDIKDFELDIFRDIFHIKSKCKISVRRDSHDAQVFQQQIMDHFPK
jgi:hypothetical protein